MQRPTGITILAILWFIGAIGLVIGALVFFTGGSLVAQILANTPGMSRFAGGMVAAGGVVFLLLAVLYALTGYGLWSLKNWGRIIAIIFTALGLIGTLLGFVTVFSSFGMAIVVGQVIKLAICAWILWYLFQPNVKQAFGQTA